jgi:uncharacterized membrane-anchored protein
MESFTDGIITWVATGVVVYIAAVYLAWAFTIQPKGNRSRLGRKAFWFLLIVGLILAMHAFVLQFNELSYQPE